MDAWFGFVSSLAGVVVGAAATFATQEAAFRRTTRRDIYGTFASRCNAARDALLDVRHSVKHDTKEKSDLWHAANAKVSEVSSQSAYLGLIARDRTSQAAETLEEHLMQLKQEFATADMNRNKVDPAKVVKEDLEYRDAYDPLLREFHSAAGDEIRIRRRRRDAATH